MRIVVNDTAASKTGALSILKDFYGYIKKEGTVNKRTGEKLEWIFLLSDEYIKEEENIRTIILSKVKKSRKERLFFDLKNGGEYINSLEPDVCFSLQNTLTRGVKAPSALYVHQPIPFQRTKNFSLLKPEEREYAVYQHIIGRLILSSVKRADKTIVQTEWMREEAIKRTGADPSRIIKITPDIDISFGGKTPHPGEDKKEPFVIPDKKGGAVFFYPSGDMLYKNHMVIIQALKLLSGDKDIKVILTLTEEELLRLCPKEEEFIKTLLAGKEASPLVCRGRMKREEVLFLMKNTTLLFPSYIESYGYPPAEARAMGGRVIAADIPASREVLEGYDKAVFFDPFDPKGLSELMRDQALREKEGSSRGDEEEAAPKENPGPSSWSRVLEELIGLGARKDQ